MSKTCSTRHVRSSTEINKGRGVRVGRDERITSGLGEVFITAATRHGLNDLNLERLILEDREALFNRVFASRKGLILGDNDAHLRVDALEIVVTKVTIIRKFKVVVEAVTNRWTNGVVRPGPQSRDRLGHHVCARVSQY